MYYLSFFFAIFHNWLTVLLLNKFIHDIILLFYIYCIVCFLSNYKAKLCVFRLLRPCLHRSPALFSLPILGCASWHLAVNAVLLQSLYKSGELMVTLLASITCMASPKYRVGLAAMLLRRMISCKTRCLLWSG